MMATEVASPAAYMSAVSVAASGSGAGSAPPTPTIATPSSATYPSGPSGIAPPPPSSASKRPPRKSTLTQQQKLQKRQRATQDQLTTLEMEFNKNPTPAAEVRLQIAEEINMTERSVQIWFQNR
jgi:hypothetical protein